MECRPVADADRDELATVLLAAYRGTIDDEGEELIDAYEAIDYYLSAVVREHSVVVLASDGSIVSASFVLVVDDRHFIDPVFTRPDVKRRGIGSSAVRASLASLADAAIEEVGAVITDGNSASERLFTGLGFLRVGGWA